MGKLSEKANDPAITPAQLEKLWNENRNKWDTREEGLAAIARNPKTPVSVLEEMIKPPDVPAFLKNEPSIQRMVLSHRRLAEVASENLRKRGSGEREDGNEQGPGESTIQALKDKIVMLEDQVKKLEKHEAP
nr:hypothetical protein [Candidatus Sigynarchaeota archaeon]